MYTVDDEGLEQNGAVLGLADGFVNHAGSLGRRDGGFVRRNKKNRRREGRGTRGDLDGHGGGRQEATGGRGRGERRRL